MCDTQQCDVTHLTVLTKLRWVESVKTGPAWPDAQVNWTSFPVCTLCTCKNSFISPLMDPPAHCAICSRRCGDQVTITTTSSDSTSTFATSTMALSTSSVPTTSSRYSAKLKVAVVACRQSRSLVVWRLAIAVVHAVVARLPLVTDSIWVVCWKPAILIVFWNIWITREAQKVAVMKCKHCRQGLLDLDLESEHNEAPAVAVSGDRSTSAASDLSCREKSNVIPPFFLVSMAISSL